MDETIMTNVTRIEWTEVTLNPVTGCTKVSPGCDHCYAEVVTNRYRQHFPNGFEVTLRPERLSALGRMRKPKMIFMNSMSDLSIKTFPTSL